MKKCPECGKSMLTLDEPWDMGDSQTDICLNHFPPMIVYNSYNSYMSKEVIKQRLLTRKEYDWLMHYVAKFKELGNLLSPLVKWENGLREFREYLETDTFKY